MKLTDKRLILVVGKGGVGRSTVAATIALQCASAGKKTLLYETNANDRFGNYFDKPSVGSEPSQLAPNLWAVNATPASALAEYGLMVLRWKSVYEMVFENRVTRAFLRAIPGLDDYALLGKAWFHTTEEKRGKPVWDTVIFDMPASGHSFSMLRVPWVIVDTVPEGPLTRDARTVRELLTDPARTAAVLVTLAEEMPVNEAIELETKLVGLGILPQHLIVNQLYPAHFPSASPVAKVLDTLLANPQLAPPLAAVAAHASLSRDRRLLNERYLAEVRKRARTPVSELPMLFAQRLGPAHIHALAERLSTA
ncbi:MAG: ArsA family ATPase [Deltaproteobacteria bacterium]|nr:ArsA family ATPase [Deltaproteobacteria bacterium]MDQ3296029.1 ArsA family ATPase [Myxococcota bacterium]